MNDKLVESVLRSRCLPGLSDAARSRLLAELDSMKMDEPVRPATAKSARPALLIGAGCALVTVLAVVVIRMLDPKTVAPTQTVADRSPSQGDMPNPQRGSPVIEDEIEERGAVAENRIANLDRRPDSALPTGPAAAVSREAMERRSLKMHVDESEVIVVATAMSAAPAPPKRPGDRVVEHLITFRVTEVLKGKLVDEEIVTQTPTDPEGFIGHPWVVMFSPEYIAGQHQYAAIWTIKVKPEVVSIIGDSADD